jgi:catechol 2,3-dioxygenase-like lactoylglutathione lyase family enzyme
MKRFHLLIAVANLAKSAIFYTSLLGQNPSTVRKGSGIPVAESTAKGGSC